MQPLPNEEMDCFSMWVMLGRIQSRETALVKIINRLVDGERWWKLALSCTLDEPAPRWGLMSTIGSPSMVSSSTLWFSSLLLNCPCHHLHFLLKMAGPQGLQVPPMYMAQWASSFKVNNGRKQHQQTVHKVNFLLCDTASASHLVLSRKP